MPGDGFTDIPSHSLPIDAIVVERKGGAEPLVGEVMPSPEGTRSSPWRFLAVEWDG
jgi:hypothetical protein